MNQVRKEFETKIEAVLHLKKTFKEGICNEDFTEIEGAFVSGHITQELGTWDVVIKSNYFTQASLKEAMEKGTEILYK